MERFLESWEECYEFNFVIFDVVVVVFFIFVFGVLYLEDCLGKFCGFFEVVLVEGDFGYDGLF